MNALPPPSRSWPAAAFCLTVVLSHFPLSAQPRPAFEVASVKESKSGGLQDFAYQPGGRLVVKGIQLIYIIRGAYSMPLKSDRLSGGPAWIQTTTYDIEAYAGKDALPAGTSANARDQVIRLMLQTLLEERFKLRMRRETQEQPVYAITVKAGGPKLKQSKLQEKDCVNVPTSPASGDPSACHTFAGGAVAGIRAHAASISDLVLWMLNWADHPLVDKTGLTGLFDIETEAWDMPVRKNFSPDEAAAADAAAQARPNLFEIFDRLGLKLVLQKGPVDSYVIENVERPSTN